LEQEDQHSKLVLLQSTANFRSFQQEDLHIKLVLLQSTANLKSCFGAFRQSSQMQQCARLLTSYGQRLPDPRQCILANARMTACLQQQSTFCTGMSPCLPAQVFKSFNIGYCMLIEFEAHMSNCRDSI